MSTDGKQLEALVAFVEQVLVPSGCRVKTNNKVFDEDGVQLAEFDIEVAGRVGTVELKWLIECRDRPKHGAAPGSWIEQLAGRRDRFAFNKVTAVSTTGFAPSAIHAAQRLDIALREVEALDPDHFRDWIEASTMLLHTQEVNLIHADLAVDPSIPDSVKDALQEKMSNIVGSDPFLRSVFDDSMVTLGQAFLGSVRTIDGIFDDVIPDGSPKKVAIATDYPKDDDHFVIDSIAGSARVLRITFIGELKVSSSPVDMVQSMEYRHHGTDEPISQVVSYDIPELEGSKYTVEFHHVKQDGTTRVVLRKR